MGDFFAIYEKFFFFGIEGMILTSDMEAIDNGILCTLRY